MIKALAVLAITGIAAICGMVLAVMGESVVAAFQMAVENGSTLIIALTCTAIVLLILARKGYLNARNMYLGLWALLIANRILTQRVDSVDVQNLSLSSLLGEISITMAILAGASILLVNRLTQRRRFTISGTSLCFVGYVTFAFISILWTPDPTYAGFWLLRLISIAIILVLYFEDVTQQKINLFIGATLLGLLPIVVAPIVYFLQGNPIYSDRIIAGWIGPATISVTAAALSTYCLLRAMQTSRVGWLGLSIICFLSLFLAGGKTGAVAVPCSLLLVALVSTRTRLVARILVFFAFIGILLLSNWTSLADMDIGLISHTQTYIDSANFSSMAIRFDLWNGALNSWLSSPLTFLFGRGYTASRISGISTFSGTWVASHAHNSTLQSFFELGLPGGLLLLTFILYPTLRAVRHAREPSNELLVPLLGALFVLLVGSLTDDVFGGLLHAPFFLLVSIIASIDGVLSLGNRRTDNRLPSEYSARHETKTALPVTANANSDRSQLLQESRW